MANESCGTLLCPMCETPGEVRRYKNHARGKMYIACECGQIRPAMNQSYILRNGEFIAGHALAPDAGEIAGAKAAYSARKGSAPAPAGEPVEAREKSTPAPQAPKPEVVTEKPKVAKPVNEKSPPKKPVKVRAQERPQVKTPTPTAPVKKWGGFF